MHGTVLVHYQKQLAANELIGWGTTSTTTRCRSPFWFDASLKSRYLPKVCAGSQWSRTFKCQELTAPTSERKTAEHSDMLYDESAR